MLMKNMLVFVAAGFAAVAVTACSSDVEPPNDPEAKEWTAPIKDSYPDWQPTQQAPEGNAKYEELFNKPAGDAALVAAPADAFQQVPASENAAPAEQVPGKVRLDVTSDGKIRMNGVQIDDAQISAGVIEKYLKSIATAHKGTSMAIIHPLSSKAPQDKLDMLLDLCRKTGIAKVSFVPAGRVEPSSSTPSKTAAAPAKRVKVVVDTSKPAGTYTVQTGDSLSKIAQKQYGNAALWYVIYNANKSSIKNANRLVVNSKLTIPAVKIQESAK